MGHRSYAGGCQLNARLGEQWHAVHRKLQDRLEMVEILWQRPELEIGGNARMPPGLGVLLEAAEEQLPGILLAAYDFPLFNLARPDGKPPFVLRDRGRAIITAPQGLNARPFEFRYSASFRPTAVEQPVATLGQRTLRIESIDLKVNGLTGFPGLDPKIIEIRDALRSRFNIPPDDLGAAVKLAAALAAYMGRVLQDNEITEVLSEKRFQALVRAELRRRPEIGSALSEHPRAAGGITDLTLLGVPLELKVEGEKRLALENCQQFVGQTTSYVHGNGKRVGVLCVMDCSPKTQAAAPAEACIGILQDETSGANTPIIAVLVQANLAKPSSLSR